MSKLKRTPSCLKVVYRVPRKACIGGVKARRVFGFSIKDANREENSNLFNKWKELHRVVKDNAGGRAIQNHKANVWKSLDKIFYYVEQ